MYILNHRRLLLPFLALAVLASPRAFSQTDADRAAWAEISAQGDGFVVWETNRDGRWRIWRRELDGSNPRRISHDEADHDHIAPAVSPDGRWIAYMSQLRGIDYGEPKSGQKSPLRIMRADGSQDRLLVEDTRRISSANRAVVWVDENRLHFLGGDHLPRSIDLRSGDVSKPLHNERGFIPNAAMTYVMDRYHVHPFDAATRTVRKTGRKFDGCEPTFTSDSRWSVRMTGAGGPIARIDPASGAIHPLLTKGDSRLPKDRGYLYFPMVSPCRRLMAYAASPNQHDHFKSDYEVFVVPVNPETLEVSGAPVRYTFDARTDRYPDVFLADLPLGRHVGEAPFSVTFQAPGGASARWSSGDGAAANGPRFTHTYVTAGRFAPVAVVNGREYRGQVTVAPAVAPSVELVAVAEARVLQVVFDEPVDVSRLRASLASGIAVKADKLSDDQRRLTLRLAADLPDKDDLRLAGAIDLAQRPNEMKPAVIPVERAQWPVSNDGLLLSFESGGKPALLRSGKDRLDVADLVTHGAARRDRHGALEVGGGAFTNPEAGAILSREIKAANALSIEVVFRSAGLDQRGPARIVTLSRDTGSRNFTLGQERDRLVLRLRTPRTGGNAVSPDASLGSVALGQNQHVVVTYRAPNELVAYIDGKEVFRRKDSIQGDLSNWDDSMIFLLGDEGSADRDWRGAIEAVALYRRVLTAEEAVQAALAWKHRLAARVPARKLQVEAEVAALSPMPTLAQIAPYREGLLLAEYRVKRAEGPEAPAAGSLLRVAHWALLDGKPLPRTAALRAGQSISLELEPFAEQPQLKALFLSDELEMDLDAPIFYDVSQP